MAGQIKHGLDGETLNKWRRLRHKLLQSVIVDLASNCYKDDVFLQYRDDKDIAVLIENLCTKILEKARIVLRADGTVFQGLSEIKNLCLNESPLAPF